jgi:MFS family permease
VSRDPLGQSSPRLTYPLDSNNYAAAKLQGLTEDLSLSDTEYQTGLSVLFVAYILMQVPSNLMLNYMGRPSLYLGFFVTAWGLVSAVTSQAKSYGGIVACRFFLGFVGKSLVDHTAPAPFINSQMQRPLSLPVFSSTCRSGTPRGNWHSE